MQHQRFGALDTAPTWGYNARKGQGQVSAAFQSSGRVAKEVGEVEIRFELLDEQVAQVKRALHRSRFDDLESAATALAQLATAAWLDWLSGEQRYNSLTQQYADWVETLYLNLLPEEEAPSVDRLYNNFNIPYGQAQYITRMLNNKTMTFWRQRAIERLRTMMEEKLPEVEEWLENNEPLLRAELIVDKLAYLELRTVCDRLFELAPGELFPPDYKTKGGLYQVSIPAGSFKAILAELSV